MILACGMGAADRGAWAQQAAPRVTPQQIQPDVRLQQLPPTEPRAPAPEFPVPEMPPTRAPAGAETVRFVFGGLEIEGASVYVAETLDAQFRDSVGQEITLADAFAMADRVQRLYRDDGYFLTRVIVPAQTVRDGKLRIRVLEGYIAAIEFQDDIGSAQKLVQAYLRPVTAQRPIRLATLERALLLSNDIPGLSVAALLEPSGTELGAADLFITATRKPFDGFATVDNFGDEFTGEWEGAAGVSSNAFTRFGERVSLIGLISEPWVSNNEMVGQLSGSWRLGGGGLFFEHLVSYGKSKPGSTIEEFGFDSKELLIGTTAVYPILRTRNLNLWVRAGFDYTDANTDVFGGEKFSRDRLRVIHTGIKSELRDGWRGFNVGEVTFRQGLPVLNATKRSDDFKSREDGTATSSLIDASIARRQPVYGDVSLYGHVAGQYAFTSLLSEQEFDVGGLAFGRGYNFAELSGDNGVGATVELQYTYRPKRWSIDTVQPFAFYDFGEVWTRDSASTDQQQGSLSSAGIGVRGTALDMLTIEIIVAKPLTRDSERANGGREPQVLFRAIGRF